MLPFSSAGSPISREGAKNGVASKSGRKVVELDARVLAKECLREVGKEMGVGW
jgi:hypothetical protein